MDSPALDGFRRRERLSVLLLTDVEGSTEHWHRDPRQMSAAMDLVDVAVEHSVAPGAGDIVRSRGEGDSHFVVFTAAMEAVRAAATLHRLLSETPWPAGLALRVRAALHAGDVKQRGNDYEGIAINRTARLRSTAHGGQVVASRAVVELTGADLPDGLRFESLGRHRVRDLPGWSEIYQLCGPAMDHDFPSLVTLDTGLPPVTTIVYLDAVGASQTTRTWSPEDIHAALANLVEVFAATFSSSGGQYLKQLGDGCIALFADPDAALAFARGARTAAMESGVSLRCVVHVGRVEFIHEEPVGTLLLATSALIRQAPPDRIALSSAAAALVEASADLIILN
jgi:class 3 adenylate cyclase